MIKDHCHCQESELNQENFYLGAEMIAFIWKCKPRINPKARKYQRFISFGDETMNLTRPYESTRSKEQNRWYFGHEIDRSERNIQ